MKVPVNSIRAGNVIEYNGKLWVASKVQHISPGKGGAFVAIEAKALREGNKLQERFRSGETIEQAHIEERECTFLFGDDSGFTFMDKENYEQLVVGADVLDPDQSRWLQDGMEVLVALHEGTPVSVTLPKSVVLAVTATLPAAGPPGPFPGPGPAAELTVTLLLTLARNVAQAHASMKQGEWKRSKYVGIEVTS